MGFRYISLWQGRDVFEVSIRIFSPEGFNQMRNVVTLLIVPATWLIGSGVCWSTCKFRKVDATLLQCLIIAGLPLAIGALPLPLPYLLQVALRYALTVYVTMKYLGISLVPDGLLIPCVTALGSAGASFVLEQVVGR